MSVVSKMFGVMRQSWMYIRHSKPVHVFLIVTSMCGVGILSRFRSLSFIRRMEGGDAQNTLKDGQLTNMPNVNEEIDFSSFKTLKDFGYDFNESGQFRNIKTGDAFEFKVREDHKYNQKRYEAIGELITEQVYGLLESEVGLERLQVPIDATEDEPTSFIFVSDDYQTNEKLMVLIHGSGVVRAGQWARRLIINDDLSCGTQIPYIKRAKQEGYAIMVLNTNNNKVEIDGKEATFRGSERPEAHGRYVWNEIVSKLPAKHIAIVAHSYGGLVTAHVAGEFAEDFEKRVFAIAFTDSVHSLDWQQVPESIVQLFKTKAINYVSSDEPLDTPIKITRNDAPRVSAGHPKHEWTSWSAMSSVFKFFNQKFAEVQPPPPVAQKEEPSSDL